MSDKKDCYPTYTCLRCSLTTFGVEACARSVVAKFIVSNRKVNEFDGVERTKIHHCDDSGAGFSEFIGVTPIEVYEELERLSQDDDDDEEGPDQRNIN